MIHKTTTKLEEPLRWRSNMKDYKVMDRPYTEKEIRDNIDEN